MAVKPTDSAGKRLFAAATESLFVLHDRIVKGDVAASHDLATALLPALRDRLRRTFPKSSEDARHDATVDALIQYLRTPARYEPERQIPLDVYLLHAARRNLIDLWRAETRRRVRDNRYGEEHRRTAEHRPGPPRIEARQLAGMVASVAASAAERRAVWCWLSGDGGDGIASALDLAHLAGGDRRAEVKRFKDRIVKRLRRSSHTGVVTLPGAKRGHDHG